MSASTPAIFRFAPSPNGALHLGHAYSALLNQRLCHETGGTYLLRLEDIDLARCTRQLETQMLEDLEWLGIRWSGTPRRQSEHFEGYKTALGKLRDTGLIYPAFLTRGEIKRSVGQMAEAGQKWPRDPDGSPHYPGDERDWSNDRQEAACLANPKHTWRLDMNAALQRLEGRLTWQELHIDDSDRVEEITAQPEKWGDVVLARSDIPTSYHLSVTVDDAAQQISHVVRGSDLYQATSIHRLLQTLLGFPEPLYHHHQLVLDADGLKLSKSKHDVSLRALRDSGVTAQQIPELFHFAQRDPIAAD